MGTNLSRPGLRHATPISFHTSSSCFSSVVATLLLVGIRPSPLRLHCRDNVSCLNRLCHLQRGVHGAVWLRLQQVLEQRGRCRAGGCSGRGDPDRGRRRRVVRDNGGEQRGGARAGRACGTVHPAPIGEDRHRGVADLDTGELSVTRHGRCCCPENARTRRRCQPSPHVAPFHTHPLAGIRWFVNTVV